MLQFEIDLRKYIRRDPPYWLAKNCKEITVRQAHTLYKDGVSLST